MWKRKPTVFDWVKCQQPDYSFYHRFMAEYWEGGPSEELGACLHRLCTLGRKMEVTSFVVEEGLGRPDIDEEIAHLEAMSGRLRGSVRASVVTFLTRGVREDGDLDHIDRRHVIGQFTIISFPHPAGPRSYIFEAVHRLPSRNKKPLLNNLISLQGLLSVTIGKKTIRLPAAYFCQQNGVTSICAHSALRMLVRTKTDQPLSVANLNEYWSYEAGGKVTAVELLAALRHYGFNVVPFGFHDMPPTLTERQPDNVWGLLALLADSGSSSLLIFSAGSEVDHVVPVVGNTVNTDEWHPLGASLHVNGEEHVSSNSVWIDHLVVHDDMLGPYYCLSRAALFPSQSEEPLNVHLAIAILPDGVLLSPQQADGVGREALSELITLLAQQDLGRGDWWTFLCKSFERRICRTVLIDRKTYIDMLRDPRLTSAQHRHLDSAERDLPEYLWMCELSLPNLFLANRAKLGEVLIDATKPLSPDSFGSIHGFRLPSLLGWSHPQRGQNAFSVSSWPVDAHVPMYETRNSEPW